MSQAEVRPYQETYSRMGDDELLHLVPQLHTLTEAAQAALAAELEKRELNVAVEAVPKHRTEKSAIEKFMLVLFICSAITYVMRQVWPINLFIGGLTDIVDGISGMWLLWLIVWLVLLARRIQKG
jgi:hypothetical protein